MAYGVLCAVQCPIQRLGSAGDQRCRLMFGAFPSALCENMRAVRMRMRILLNASAIGHWRRMSVVGLIMTEDNNMLYATTYIVLMIFSGSTFCVRVLECVNICRIGGYHCDVGAVNVRRNAMRFVRAHMWVNAVPRADAAADSAPNIYIYRPYRVAQRTFVTTLRQPSNACVIQPCAGQHWKRRYYRRPCTIERAQCVSEKQTHADTQSTRCVIASCCGSLLLLLLPPCACGSVVCAPFEYGAVIELSVLLLRQRRKHEACNRRGTATVWKKGNMCIYIYMLVVFEQ